MTDLDTGARRSASTPAPSWVPWAGMACLVAGILGAASGLALAVWPAQVSEDMYSYPFGVDGFVAAQVWFAVQHLGLLVGVLALAPAGVMVSTRWARAGAGLAAAGVALLTVTELLAVTARDSTYPGEGTDLLDTFYGVSTVAAGIGLVVAGVAVRRAGRWTGWRRNLVLVTGIFVFVPMTPAIMGPFVLARLAIAGWMLLFAALGWALWQDGRSRDTSRPTP